MVDKKVIILSTVAIILMIILVFICFGSNLSVFKQETDLVITSNSTLNNGDDFTVKLADNNGKGIANKTVCIKLVDDGGNVNNLNITTDKNGVSSFGINANSGNYVAKCVFLGDDNYDSSNIVQNISIIILQIILKIMEYQNRMIIIKDLLQCKGVKNSLLLMNLM